MGRDRDREMWRETDEERDEERRGGKGTGEDGERRKR